MLPQIEKGVAAVSTKQVAQLENLNNLAQQHSQHIVQVIYSTLFYTPSPFLTIHILKIVKKGIGNCFRKK